MQRRLIYKIYTVSLVFTLLVTNVAVAESSTEKSWLKNSPQLLAGQWNPWLLPEVAEKEADFQCPADWRTQGNSAGTQQQGQPPEFKKRLSGRFVTPGILQSLKQQQIQTQMTPSTEHYRQSRSRQRMPQQPVTRLPGNGYNYGQPSSGGMGTANPLYDVPAVSPWGSGPDVIYRGGSIPGALPDSSPWVPNEAVGGLLPMPVSPFAGNASKDELNSINSGNAEIDNIERRRDNNVFNPYTFIPNRSW